jgi:hypothetical protein
MALRPDVERLALLGWRPHPTSQCSRATCFSGAAILATCDLDKLTHWSREYPGCGWRVVMQWLGIWALDVDVPSVGHAGGYRARVISISLKIATTSGCFLWANTMGKNLL